MQDNRDSRFLWGSWCGIHSCLWLVRHPDSDIGNDYNIIITWKWVMIKSAKFLTVSISTMNHLLIIIIIIWLFMKCHNDNLTHIKFRSWIPKFTWNLNITPTVKSYLARQQDPQTGRNLTREFGFLVLVEVIEAVTFFVRSSRPLKGHMDWID